MASYQAPLSLGFSRQEYWGRLPFSSLMRESEVAQSYPTLSDLMDGSLPGSSVHGIFQARVFEFLSKLCELVMSREGWHAAVHGGHRVRHHIATEQEQY